MKTRLLVCLYLITHTIWAQTTDLEKSAIRVLEGAYENVEVKNIFTTSGGDVKITARVDSQFGEKTYLNALIAPNLEIKEERFDVTKSLNESFYNSLEDKGGRKSVAYVTYIKGEGVQSNYQVVIKGGEYVVFDDEFKRLDRGSVMSGAEPEGMIAHDMKQRFDNCFVVRGTVSEKGFRNYSITYKNDYMDFQFANVVYNERSEWIKTREFLGHYDYLPIDLMMYVNDNGGLENFKHVEKELTPESIIFKVTFKDGSSKQLDVNFKEL